MSQPASYAEKHYTSAQKRLVPALVAGFFEENFPRLFGPEIRARIADRLLTLMEEQCPPASHLRSGQCVWNAVARETRADSPKLRLIPVVLTLIAETDLTRLAAGESRRAIQRDVIARLMREAFAQGALLSVRDIGLLLGREDATISHLRQEWEAAAGEILPHPGSLQDMGSCLTHKVAIVIKAVYERKDTRQVARETRHTQQAVDRYLRDFHRVRTCYRHTPDVAFISQVTNMSPHLITQYLDIIEKYEQNPLTGESA